MHGGKVSRPKRRQVGAVAGVLALGGAMSVTGLTLAHADPVDSITICHATDDPDTGINYSAVEASTIGSSGAWSQYASNSLDIIPEFDSTDGVTSFAGQNWTDDGQAIWNDGCSIAGAPDVPVDDSSGGGSIGAGSTGGTGGTGSVSGVTGDGTDVTGTTTDTGSDQVIPPSDTTTTTTTPADGDTQGTVVNPVVVPPEGDETTPPEDCVPADDQDNCAPGGGGTETPPAGDETPPADTGGDTTPPADTGGAGSGGGGGTTTPTATAPADNSLAYTGAESNTIAGLGALLLAAGTGLMWRFRGAKN